MTVTSNQLQFLGNLPLPKGEGNAAEGGGFESMTISFYIDESEMFPSLENVGDSEKYTIGKI